MTPHDDNDATAAVGCALSMLLAAAAILLALGLASLAERANGWGGRY